MLARRLLILAAGSFLAAVAGAAPTLTISNATAQAGGTADLTITFGPAASDNVAVMAFELTLPPGISTVSYTAGAATTAANKSITPAANLIGGNRWRVTIFNSADTSTPIGAGALLTLRVQAAAAGSYQMVISNPDYADTSANAVTPGAISPGTLTVTAVTPTNIAPTVNAGPDQSITLPSLATLSGTASDDGLPNPPAAITTTWSMVSGPGTVNFGNVNNRSTTATFSLAGTYTLRLTASDNSLSATDNVVITVNAAPPVNAAPTVNAGPDQSITLPSLATLSGTASDDGLPNPPAAITTTWSMVSGPGTVNFGNVNNRSTTATFSLAGTYTLRLTATDGTLSATDNVVITVNAAPPVNAAPTVNAGPDQSITLPSLATLSGTASDDGLPNPPAAITTTWSMVSGPGTVNFGNVNNRSTTATFSLAGTYTLRLTASDNSLSATDNVVITVNAAPPVNAAPTVNAGPDQSITLPSLATLSGTASDDGRPNPPAAITTAWSQISGPGTVTFGNVNNRSTTATFSLAGSYTLRLTATDSVLSATDDVVITVGAIPTVIAPTLTVGNVSGVAGTTVDFPITFNPGSTSVALIAFELNLPVNISTVTIIEGPAMTAANKHATNGASNNRWRFAIYSSLGTETIGNGLLFTARVQIAGGTAPQVIPINVLDSSFADPAANDIPAGSHTSGSITVGSVSNQAPTVATAASATPSPVTGTTTSLSVLGADDGGAANLIYTWAVTGTPPATPTYTGVANGTNGARTITATFTRAGSYTFQATIRDAQGLTATSSVAVLVNQALTTINVTPASQNVTINTPLNFSAAGLDQFGQTMASAPTIVWTVSGGGTISNAGVFTAGATAGGPFTVTATSGGRTGTTQVTVVTAANQPPTVATAASATPNPVTGNSTTLSVLGADDGGAANLIYTWAVTGTPPATPSYSGATNGTNAARTITATFSRAGSYAFRATIQDAQGRTVTSNVTVTVNQTLTSINVTPQGQNVTVNTSLTFQAAALDQFARAMTTAPGITWTVSGGGSISNTGVFTAGATAGGPFTVTAAGGARTGTAQVNVVTTANQRPTVAIPASATPNPVTGTTTDLSVLGADDGGADNLIYTWTLTGTPPAPPTFSGATNGTNGARMITATLPRAGSYSFLVTIRDAQGLTVTSSVIVTLTAPTLPVPSLDLPKYVPVNGSLTAGYPAGYPNISFRWTLVLNTGAANPYPIASGASRVLGRASSADFVTSNVASLAAYSLDPGVYTVTVYAVDENGATSASAHQDVTLVQSDFSGLRAFPNPWRSDKNPGTNIKFDHLPMGSTVKIFTVSGHWVKTLTPGTDPSTAEWDLKSDKGDKVASGIYIYLITVGDSAGYGGSGEKTRGKLVVIK